MCTVLLRPEAVHLEKTIADISAVGPMQPLQSAIVDLEVG
jgi:hypothetical protein